MACVTAASPRKKKLGGETFSTKTEHEAGKVGVVFGNFGEQLYLQFNITLFDANWINARFVIGQKP